MTAPANALEYRDDFDEEVRRDEPTWIETGSCCPRCHREELAEQWLAARGGAA